MFYRVSNGGSISSVTATSGGSSRSATYNNLDTNKLYVFIGAQLSMYSNLNGSITGLNALYSENINALLWSSHAATTYIFAIGYSTSRTVTVTAPESYYGIYSHYMWELS